MEIQELYANSPSDTPKTKLITLQYLIDNPSGGGEGPGLGGTNYLFVKGDGTASENAAELQAAYNTAKGMSPAIANVITVVVAPGKYAFGATKFEPDTAYINIVSLTGNSNVLLDGINVTADNVFLKGLNCGENTFGCLPSLGNLILENCTGGNYSFGYGSGYGGTFSGTATNCIGGDGSFGGYGGTFSGIATNCTGGNYSFGGDVNGTFSGTATNCTGGNYSFGSGDSATFSGAATNCTGGNYSFGSGDSATFSGAATNCTGGNYSFCSGDFGYLMGTVTNCTGGDSSFASGGTFSGIATNCTGGNSSFGTEISDSARLYYCKLTSGSFISPQAGGKLVLCIDGSAAIVTTA